jgi:hypothetical protein
MDEYTQVLQKTIDKDYIFFEDSKILFYNSLNNIVTDFEPHKSQQVQIGINVYNTKLGKPLYVKTDDYKNLLEYIKTRLENNKILEENNKKLTIEKNTDMLTKVHESVVGVINKSNLLSQNDKTSFVKKLNNIKDKLQNNLSDEDYTFNEKKILLLLSNQLNTEMKSLLLFSNIKFLEYKNNDNITIENKGFKFDNNREYTEYSLKITVPNIIFLYNFETETLSLSKLDSNKEYKMELNENLMLTIDNTILPTTTTIASPGYTTKKVFFIYKVEGNPEPVAPEPAPVAPEPAPVVPVAPSPTTLTKCIGDACRKTIRYLTGQSARVNPGGKRTRKHMYSARSRGIITLRNTSAFRKQKNVAKGRRKIEHSTSFRNKR